MYSVSSPIANGNKNRLKVRAVGGKHYIRVVPVVLHIDLVLVDLKMPIVDGFRVLEWLQAPMPEVPAAVVSSSELKADKERARDLGAVAYFRKEQNFEVVLGYIRDLAA